MKNMVSDGDLFFLHEKSETYKEQIKNIQISKTSCYYNLNFDVTKYSYICLQPR